jgi:hypothetical protein
LHPVTVRVCPPPGTVVLHARCLVAQDGLDVRQDGNATVLSLPRLGVYEALVLDLRGATGDP